MAKVNNCEYVNEPEVLVGMGVNWAKYNPPGGYLWQERYRTVGHECLAKARGEVAKRKNEIATFDIDFNELNIGITNLRRLLNALNNPVGKKFIGNTIDGPSEWINASKALCNNFDVEKEALSPERGERTAIETDLAFIDALVKFFDSDLETDMLLFALSGVDKKYRTKVLRAALKSLRNVEEAMEVIDHTNSLLKVPFFDRWYGEPYKYLSMCYGRVGLSLRSLKKAMEKGGAKFWDVNTVESFLGSTDEMTLNSVVEWVFGDGKSDEEG